MHTILKSKILLLLYKNPKGLSGQEIIKKTSDKYDTKNILEAIYELFQEDKIVKYNHLYKIKAQN